MTKHFPLTAAIVLGIVNDFRISLKLIALLFFVDGTLKYSGTKYFTMVLQTLFIMENIGRLEIRN